VAPIPAGTWHLVGDGEVIASVDIRYDLIWRAGGGDAGGTDVVLATFDHHFDPQPSGFDAVAFEDEASGPAADAKAGDLLVLRITASNTTASTAFIPNGDGASSNGRIPYVDLPLTSPRDESPGATVPQLQ
jgi:hypothetical protein